MSSNPSLLYSISLYNSTSLYSSHYWWSSWSGLSWSQRINIAINVIENFYWVYALFGVFVIRRNHGSHICSPVHTAEQVSQTIVQFILTMCFYSHFSPTTNSIYNCRISLSLSLVSIIPNHFFAGLIWWILVQTANKHVAPCFIF